MCLKSNLGSIRGYNLGEMPLSRFDDGIMEKDRRMEGKNSVTLNGGGMKIPQEITVGSAF